MITASLAGASIAGAQSALPPGFVHLRTVDPSIVQDIRYAGSNNFVGRPLDGYEASECILRHDAAAALKRVQADLATVALGLKVYDCYRPERAVRAMVRWVSGRPDGHGKQWHPRLERRSLLSGYIAIRSRHSTGTAVDLTLIKRGEGHTPPSPHSTVVPCTAPAAERGETGIDMGTGFDCFDPNSHTKAYDIGAEPRRWRAALVGAMAKRGFSNYPREWWHFTYVGAAPLIYYDFPVLPP